MKQPLLCFARAAHLRVALLLGSTQAARFLRVVLLVDLALAARFLRVAAPASAARPKPPRTHSAACSRSLAYVNKQLERCPGATEPFQPAIGCGASFVDRCRCRGLRSRPSRPDRNRGVRPPWGYDSARRPDLGTSVNADRPPPGLRPPLGSTNRTTTPGRPLPSSTDRTALGVGPPRSATNRTTSRSTPHVARPIEQRPGQTPRKIHPAELRPGQTPPNLHPSVHRRGSPPPRSSGAKKTHPW